MNQYEQVHHREEVWTSQLVPLLPRGRQHQRSPYWSPQVLYNTTVSRFEQLKRDVRRGVEFGIETKALLYKRMCAYAGLHAIVIKGFCKVLSSDHSVDCQSRTPRQRSTSLPRSLWTTVGGTPGTPSTLPAAGDSSNQTGRPCKCRPRWGEFYWQSAMVRYQYYGTVAIHWIGCKLVPAWLLCRSSILSMAVTMWTQDISDNQAKFKTWIF